MNKEVTLYQILQAREDRAARQQELLERYGRTLICFTMNIPGPVKISPLIRRSFRWGLRQLDEAFPQPLHRQIREEITGCEAFYVPDLPAEEAKRRCAGIEDGTALGRLFDMDVIAPTGEKLDRELVGGGSRDCIVCGATGRGCASRRLHSVAELTAAVTAVMEAHFLEMDSCRIGHLAAQSLLEEVHTTPKPGLVDRRNNGSHRDMDLPLFIASAEALEPYFVQCVRIGRETREEPPEVTFRALRSAGLAAEETMYRVTSGVNTHKGAIFTLGLLCGSAGRLWKPEAMDVPLEDLLARCGELGSCALSRDFGQLTVPETAGEKLYVNHGLAGIRGEAAAGLPSARMGLKIFREALAQGKDPNDAGVLTLLHLMAKVEDTNLYHRGGEAGAAWAKAEAEKLLPCADRERVEALDDAFIARNLSPGGCADLLATVYFLDKTEKSRQG